MRRYAAEVSYDGALFRGWQVQPGLHTVQGSLEAALEALNGTPVSVAGAGRTDMGVHARAQVCTFDLPKAWEPARLLLAINAHLPAGVSAMRVAPVPEDFHARFSAASREYVYFLWNASTIYPMLAPYVCWVKNSSAYEWSRAAEACRYLEGTHDFGAFCRAVDRPDDSVRTMFRVRLRQKGNLVWLRVLGNGFLTNMIRIMMGNLELVAKGVHDPDWIKTLLEEGTSRSEGGRTFPPEGLFLWKINYEDSPWTPNKKRYDVK